MKSSDEPKPASTPAGWIQLPVEPLPRPTFWPAGLGLAITFIFWGLIASWVIFAIGLLLFTAALTGWISAIRHERRKHDS